MKFTINIVIILFLEVIMMFCHCWQTKTAQKNGMFKLYKNILIKNPNQSTELNMVIHFRLLHSYTPPPSLNPPITTAGEMTYIFIWICYVLFRSYD